MIINTKKRYRKELESLTFPPSHICRSFERCFQKNIIDHVQRQGTLCDIYALPRYERQHFVQTV